MLIAHLSDPHLVPRGELYHGLVDSNAQFDAALRQVAAMDPAPDLVLISGDLVDDGAAASYALAREKLAALPCPMLVIPGNHDDRETFRAAFADQPGMPAAGPLHQAMDLGPLRILALDISVPGDHHGEMDAPALTWLEARLDEAPDRPTLIMMHQPPARIGMGFIDQYNCRGEAALEALIARHPQVERLLCAHIHRVITRRFGGTLLMTAPSTATAIGLDLRDDPDRVSYQEPPAMLLHHWRAETQDLVSHLVPIGTFPGPLPFY